MLYTDRATYCQVIIFFQIMSNCGLNGELGNFYTKDIYEEILDSRPLKSPFLRDIVLTQYLVDFMQHVPKSFHSSFEVIGRCRQQNVHSITVRSNICIKSARSLNTAEAVEFRFI